MLHALVPGIRPPEVLIAMLRRAAHEGGKRAPLAYRAARQPGEVRLPVGEDTAGGGALARLLLLRLLLDAGRGMHAAEVLRVESPFG